MKDLTSREIANISMLTALSAIMMLSGIEYSFIYLYYLKFDIAELPVYIISLMFGATPTLVSSIIIGIIVALRNPVGAVFKFLAIASNGLPLALLIKSLSKKGQDTGRKMSTKFYVLIVASLSVVIRSIIMTLANCVLIEILIGPINEFASLFGYTVATLLLLTFVFNIIQGLINVLGAIFIVYRLPPEWVPEWLRRSS